MNADKNIFSELVADVREQVLYLRELGVEALDVKLLDRVESEAFRVEGKADAATVDKIISNLRSEISKDSGSEISKGSGAGISNLRSGISNDRSAKPTREPGQSRLASLPSLTKRSVLSQPSRTNGLDGGTKSEKVEINSSEPAPKDVTITQEIENTQQVENKTEMLVDAAPALPEPIETIEQIRAEIGPDCTRCKLSTLGRSQVVNSVGNFNADLMFVGEAPGADEDEQGEPFVGRAGQLLTKIIESIDLKREEVFIGNINRCRPPKNRAPEPDETIACKPFLKREIAVVRPKVIVVLGATAAENLLETKVPIGKLRGQFHDYLGVNVMPTFHPAYLLRDPHKKREVWEDMKIVRDYLRS